MSVCSWLSGPAFWNQLALTVRSVPASTQLMLEARKEYSQTSRFKLKFTDL